MRFEGLGKGEGGFGGVYVLSFLGLGYEVEGLCGCEGRKAGMGGECVVLHAHDVLVIDGVRNGEELLSTT